MKLLEPFRSFDILTLAFWLPIPIFGLSLLLSTSPTLFSAQIVNLVIGAAVFLLITQIDIDQLKPGYWLAYLFTIGIIASVFILGEVTRGSYRWIDLGFIRIQPSEVAKPFFIFFFAVFLSRFSMRKLRNFAVALVLFAIPFLLVFKEPDLGSSLVLAAIFFGMLFKSNVKLVHFGLLVLAIIGTMPIAWHFIHDYQRERVLAFLNPDYDPLGKTYNINQAMIAVGSGQVTGRGLGHGTQTQLKFLPEHTTDFIYASLGEELGFVGSVAVIALFVLLFWRLASLAEQQTDQFRALIVFGIAVMFLAQAFIHIGGNIGVLPLTGITLPFISYGGSSFIASMALLGLAMRGISKT